MKIYTENTSHLIVGVDYQNEQHPFNISILPPTVTEHTIDAIPFYNRLSIYTHDVQTQVSQEAVFDEQGHIITPAQYEVISDQWLLTQEGYYTYTPESDFALTTTGTNYLQSQNITPGIYYYDVKKYKRILSEVEINGLTKTISDVLAIGGPEPDLDWVKEHKLKKIAADRYDAETGGVNYIENDVTYVIRSDRDDVSRLKETTDAIIAHEVSAIDWKCKNALWLRIDTNNVAAIKTAMQTHIATCFAAEKAAQEAINALTTVEEVNAYTLSI